MGRRRQYGTIRRLRSGRFQARRWEDGQQVAAPLTFDTKGDAQAWLASVQTDLGRGDYIDPVLGEVPFGVYAAQWFNQKAGLQPRTRETYESQLRPMLQQFGRVHLNRIDAGGIRVWHAALLRSGRHPNTVAKIYRLFRSILATAVEDGLLRSNPCHIKRASVEAIIERPYLTLDEVGRLADAIEPRFRTLIWIAALSGLRFGELTGLARRHVSVEARTIEVERALGFVKGSGSTLGPPKSRAAYRSVVLPPSGAEILGSHLEEFVGPEGDALVFTSVKGRPLLNRYFAPSWTRAKEKAAIEQHVRFHDLRHFAGTMAATAGASLKEIKVRMGQSSNDAAVRYLKASEHRDREIADAIERRMERDMPPGARVMRASGGDRER